MVSSGSRSHAKREVLLKEAAGILEKSGLLESAVSALRGMKADANFRSVEGLDSVAKPGKRHFERAATNLEDIFPNRRQSCPPELS